MTGPDAENTAVAGREAYRAAAVGAEGEVDQPTGNGGGRTAGGAAGYAARRRRVDRRAVVGVLTAEAVGEFVA